MKMEMKRMATRLCVAAMMGGCTAAGAEVLHVPRAAKPPVLDDYVGAVPPDAGLAVSGLRQFEPGDGTPASRDTTVYLSYDDKHLYAVYVCKDDPKLVRARIARRDDLFGDDAVELLLDTFHDRQRAFRFYVNPYGVQMEGKEIEGQETDYNFDARWYSEGHLTATGWVAMMVIPFDSLRFRPGDKQSWGVAVGRVIARDGEFSYAPFISANRTGFIAQLADMEIDARIESGGNAQIIPYAYLQRARTLDTSDPMHPVWQRDDKPRVGLDAKFVIANAFATDVTIHPDFSEVESDDPQVQVNQRYRVQFPEKRPIFLENAGFFTTPQPLFYSRAVADPDIGARVTGRSGDLTVGGLLIDDKAPGRALDASDPDAGKTAAIGVLRVQKDTGAGSNVGGFVSDWKLGGKRDAVASVDVRQVLDDNWTTTWQLAESSFRDHGPASHGRLLAANLARTGRNFTYIGQWLDIAAGFKASLGFLPRVDIRQTTQTATYLWFTDETQDHWVTSAGPKIVAIRTKDHDNTLQDWSTDAAFIVNAQHATTLQADVIRAYELFDGVGFRKSAWSATATSAISYWLTPTLTVGAGDGVNYQPVAGQKPLSGKARNAALDLLFAIGRHVRVDQALLWNDLRTRSGSGSTSRVPVYRSLLARTKLTYQFNRFYAMHLILDEDELVTNKALNALPTDKHRNVDVLFSYVPIPGTAVYMGYSNLRQNMRWSRQAHELEITDSIAMNTGHQLFMKFSRLF